MYYIDVHMQVTYSICKAYDLHVLVPMDIVKLPIIVGLITLIYTFFVLDKELSYNIMLGHP